MKRFTQHLSAAALAISMVGAAQAADIVFIVDESGSMAGEHAWLGGMVTSLESELIAAGETGNNYGLVGFGGNDVPGTYDPAHQHDVGGSAMGSAAELSTATGGLIANGGFEDGYSAINFALSNYTFTSSAINFILITDEDRDVTPGSSLSFPGMEAALAEAGVVLNAVVDATVMSNSPGTAVGTNGTDAYVADGLGGYTTAAFTGYGSDYGTTTDDYSNLAIATGGASWDLNQLRAGGTTADSFTDAFVDIKVHEIITQTPEPSSLALMTLGLIGIGARRLRK
jgi:hypothetical protein